MKFKIAIATSLLLGAIVIGDGILKSNHAERKTSTLRATVEALSPQQLAVSVAECDSPPGQDGPRPHDAAYCAEVSRRLDNQPLQIVETPPIHGKP